MCSHSRSQDYFAEALRNPSFVGYRCDSYEDFKSGNCNGNEFHPFVSKRRYVRGNFYFATNPEVPFTVSVLVD